MLLYSRSSVQIVGIGFAGPDLAADIPDDQAALLLQDHPNDWSRQPFTVVAMDEVSPDDTSEE